MPATILLAVIAVCVTAALCVRWTLASRERCLAAHRAERAELYQRIQAPEVAISDHAVATGPQATVAWRRRSRSCERSRGSSSIAMPSWHA